jgi:hypothetical protein
LVVKVGGLLRQRLRDLDDRSRRTPGVLGSLTDAANVAGHVPRRHRLLFDRARDRGTDFVHLRDNLTDFADRIGSCLAGSLDTLDLLPNIFGRLGRLVGQGFDLSGDYGKAFARIAGSCRFDCRVERKQVGLTGNTGDDPRRSVDR